MTRKQKNLTTEIRFSSFALSRIFFLIHNVETSKCHRWGKGYRLCLSCCIFCTCILDLLVRRDSPPTSPMSSEIATLGVPPHA